MQNDVASVRRYLTSFHKKIQLYTTLSHVYVDLRHLFVLIIRFISFKLNYFWSGKSKWEQPIAHFFLKDVILKDDGIWWEKRTDLYRVIFDKKNYATPHLAYPHNG